MTGEESVEAHSSERSISKEDHNTRSYSSQVIVIREQQSHCRLQGVVIETKVFLGLEFVNVYEPGNSHNNSQNNI